MTRARVSGAGSFAIISGVRVVRPSSEAEMIAVFLRGELDSDRFGDVLAGAVRRAGADATLLTSPDLGSDRENRLRRRLLDETRGYSRREGLFDGFPDDVRWDRVALTGDEVATMRYINYSYWIELSGGTRRPADAAARIRSGVEAFGVPNDGFLALARAFAAGAAWPELVVVSAVPEGGDVVLEGHARLTAMALAVEAVPAEVEVLRGVSPRMRAWSEYAP